MSNQLITTFNFVLNLKTVIGQNKIKLKKKVLKF